jgi:hypothetical protein|tara:strand:- start:414 stop:668 length:255 start_codon:yes stop_codon:yes gene_type:complete
MTDLDVNVLTIIKDEVIARITTNEDFAETFCEGSSDGALMSLDYIVVSRGDEILWVVDGMTPGWYIPKSTQDVFDRYPELKGKF